MIGAFLYLLYFAACCASGLPLGFALFGRKQAAGWVAGALIGYGLVAVLFWTLVQQGWTARSMFAAALVVLGAILWIAVRVDAPAVALPPWRRRDTVALLVVLLLVPILQWRPFSRIGELDDTGARRYRAYFTADFLWHVALTSELTKFDSPPRNPYMARRPLHYYWAYFVPPAVLARHAPVLPDIRSHLLVNAFCAGLLFIAAIFVAAWCVVPRAGPVAAGVAAVVLAASAEGAWVLWSLWSRGRPLEAVCNLNIDAITAWWFQTLTIDSLPRSLWYTPQHAAACALSLCALIVPARASAIGGVRAPLFAGVALGLAVVFSPFLGGALSIVYGLAAAWTALRVRNVVAVGRFAVAGIPVLAAVGWCVAAGTFEGAGGAVTLGLSRAAAGAPVALVALALGPVLALGILAVVLGGGRAWPLATPAITVGVGLFMLYFVTLTLEPVWIGWRAGQIVLVAIPAFAAAAFARLRDAGGRPLAAAVLALVLAAGLPTTIIDAFNAQDVTNTNEAAGFRWTVVVPPDTQAAVAWIRTQTPPDAIVQMSIGPRRRESWTLIPTFGERRMAAGRPISLLQASEYDELSNAADGVFAAADAAQAATRARALRLDYVFVDQVERDAFGVDAIAKFDDPCCFTRVFTSGNAAVYAVR